MGLLYHVVTGSNTRPNSRPASASPRVMCWHLPSAARTFMFTSSQIAKQYSQNSSTHACAFLRFLWCCVQSIQLLSCYLRQSPLAVHLPSQCSQVESLAQPLSIARACATELLDTALECQTPIARKQGDQRRGLSTDGPRLPAPSQAAQRCFPLASCTLTPAATSMFCE